MVNRSIAKCRTDQVRGGEVERVLELGDLDEDRRQVGSADALLATTVQLDVESSHRAEGRPHSQVVLLAQLADHGCALKPTVQSSVTTVLRWHCV